MSKINATVLARSFGVKDRSTIEYTTEYVQDILEVVENHPSEYTVLEAATVKPNGSPLAITLSPYLLSLGATHTSVVGNGDNIQVFVPAQVEDIDLEECVIRGYIL